MAFRSPTVHRDKRIQCSNVRFHWSFSRKHFVATELFGIVFAGPYAFLGGSYVRDRTGHMVNN